MGTGNDVGRHEAVADTLTGVSACTHRGVHGTGLTAHHHSDVATTDIFAADQLHFGSLRHGVGSFDSWHHAAGFNHAEGDSLH